MRPTIILGYTLVLVIALSFGVWNIYHDQIPSEIYDLGQLPILVRLGLFSAPSSALVLWAWMFIDAISFKALRARGWWLFALVAFNWVASIAYFLVVYRQRNLNPEIKHGI